MKNIAVYGVYFGDESKGHVVQELCRRYKDEGKDVVVTRISGGPQSGHTVINNGITHICSTFGSGVLLDIPTVYNDSNCTIDPICYFKEKRKLHLRGLSPKLHLYPCIKIITPYDVAFNCQDLKSLNDGTCGKGVYATIQRYNYLDECAAKDLTNPRIVKAFLETVGSYYKKEHNFEYTIPESIEKQFIDNMIKVSNLCQKWYNLNDHDVNIRESTQGLLLDPRFSPFKPHVTATPLYYNYREDEIYLVIRTYLTRHGNGYEPKKYDDFYDLTDKFETNDFNDFQGEFKTGVLSLDLFNRVIDIYHLYDKTNVHLVITHMDIPVAQNKFFYEYNGQIHKSEGPFTPENIAATIVGKLNMNFVKVHYTDAPDSPLKDIMIT